MPLPEPLERIVGQVVARARRVTWRDAIRALPVLVPVLVLGGFVVRNFDTADFPDYEIPEGFTPAPPPTEPAPTGAPALAGVAGTTTTVMPPNAGQARLSGTVIGPAGPVPGAIVRVERSLEGGTQVVDVATAADGRYDVGGLGGGRYRVRAFLPPALAQRRAEVFFLPDGEARTVDLVVEEFLAPSVSIVVAPDPPLLDQALNLVVQVFGRAVDPDGFVRAQPVVGAFVEVLASATWERTGVTSPPSTTSTTRGSPFSTTTTVPRQPATLTTDSEGRAVATFRCVATGVTQVQVILRTAADAETSSWFFDVPGCVDPATATTTTDPDAADPDPPATTGTAVG